MNDTQFETIDLTELGTVVGGNFRSRLKKAVRIVVKGIEQVFSGPTTTDKDPPYGAE